MSVAGDHHLRAGAVCADASAAVWHRGSDTLILVAADGAGSAAHGAQGATMAVEAVVQFVSRMLDEHDVQADDPPLPEALVGGAVRAARERIEQAAKDTVAHVPSVAADRDTEDEAPATANARPIDRFATTVLAVVVTPDHLAAVQIGDGYAVRITDQGTFERLFQPQRGRFANETHFLTSLESLEALAERGFVQTRVVPAEGVAGVALITDGLEHVAMDMRAGGVPHAPFFSGLVAALSLHDPDTFAGLLERYLRGSAKVRERSDDDMTLVMAVDSCRMTTMGDHRSCTQRDSTPPSGRGAAHNEAQA